MAQVLKCYLDIQTMLSCRSLLEFLRGFVMLKEHRGLHNLFKKQNDFLYCKLFEHGKF